MIELILGGARSGKSDFAQRRAEELLAIDHEATHVEYVATATGFDSEMQQRINRHKRDRPADCALAEVPMALSQHIRSQAPDSNPITLIDCLTLWLNNQLYHAPEQDFDALFNELESALLNQARPIVLVANEVGLGVIPIGNVSRQFVDLAGRLNQKVAKIATRVTFMAAGLSMALKDEVKRVE